VPSAEDRIHRFRRIQPRELRVIDPQNVPLSRARLALCGGVRAIIAEGLGLLGVSAPETM